MLFIVFLLICIKFAAKVHYYTHIRGVIIRQRVGERQFFHLGDIKTPRDLAWGLSQAAIQLPNDLTANKGARVLLSAGVIKRGCYNCAPRAL